MCSHAAVVYILIAFIAAFNALVARGAPRDFSDIHRVIDDGVMSVEEVWDLWSKKNPDQDVELARSCPWAWCTSLVA